MSKVKTILDTIFSDIAPEMRFTVADAERIAKYRVLLDDAEESVLQGFAQGLAAPFSDRPRSEQQGHVDGVTEAIANALGNRVGDCSEPGSNLQLWTRLLTILEYKARSRLSESECAEIMGAFGRLAVAVLALEPENIMHHCAQLADESKHSPITLH